MSSSRPPAWAAIVLGTLALLAIPVAGVLAAMLSSVQAIRATTVAVAAAFVLGLAGVSAARRARFRLDRGVRRAGERVVRVASLLVWAGLYVSVVGALALGFYTLLRLSS
jgi:hypothetical protein